MYPIQITEMMTGIERIAAQKRADKVIPRCVPDLTIRLALLRGSTADSSNHRVHNQGFLISTSIGVCNRGGMRLKAHTNPV
jgi:hypothetical protein